MGDEVLRRVGRALREAVRPYDFVARYGGDEFAIVAVDAHEPRAAEIGERAIARVTAALDDVLGDGTGPHATAGVAEWRHGAAPSDLVRAADRALLYGKQEGTRGGAVLASTVPPDFSLGRALNHGGPPETAGTATWPSAVRRETEPLRKRTRQLALANALGARLAGMTRVDDIVDAAVDELHRAFGYLLCSVLRVRNGDAPQVLAVRGDDVGRTVGGRQPTSDDAVVRCIVERQPVLSTTNRGAEVALPVWAGTELWGVLDVHEEAAGVFEEPDVRMLETVSDQLGAAVRSAALYEQLERAYLGTAEALGAALEAKDSGTAEHARSIVDACERVGRRLGMNDEEIRDLRYAAAFHDIGKIAIPEQILNKPGPLTERERIEVMRHPVVGSQILQPVEFLSRILPLVRHCHEHWDGNGYPDGLAGERIPLGARVILVCDAHDAMTRDRPYRSALPEASAREEIETNAGRQFDTRVAAAFLDAGR
jgi:hypothetical protein